MSVTFGAAGPSSSGATSTTGSLSWTHVVAADDTLLLVGVGCGTDGRTLAATANGVAMTTNAGSNLWKRHTADSTSGFGQWFALPAPATGSITIAVTGGSSGDRLTGGSLSFKGTLGTAAAYGTPVSAASSGSSTPATVNVAGTAASSMVAAFMTSGTDFSVTATSPSTQRFNAAGDFSSGAGNSAGQTAPGGGTVTMACPVSAADFWAIFAVEVIAAPSGAVAGLASGTGTAPGVTAATSNLTSGPLHATAAAALAGGQGTWATPEYAEGGP